MTDEEIAVRIAEHENRIKVSEHRIEDLEEQQKQIQELTISVKELAMSVKNMVTEQTKTSDRVEKLEKAPAEQWSSTKKSLFTSVLGAIGSALGIGIIYLLYMGINGIS